MRYLILWETESKRLRRAWVSARELLETFRELEATQRRVAIVHNGRVCQIGGYNCGPVYAYSVGG